MHLNHEPCEISAKSTNEVTRHESYEYETNIMIGRAYRLSSSESKYKKTKRKDRKVQRKAELKWYEIR